MPFSPRPETLTEYMQVYLVTRRGSKRSCGFASLAEAAGEVDALRMNGNSAVQSTRWMSRKAWDEAPTFEMYF